MIQLKFKINPIAKGRPRIGNGRAYTPAKTRIFEHSIQTLAKHYMRLNGRIEPLRGPLEVLVAFHLKKPKSVRRELPEVKPDLDNLVKGLFDGCNGVLWIDDAQICMMSVTKTYSLGEGFIELIVKTI